MTVERSTRYNDHVAVRLSATLVSRMRAAAAAREQRVSELCRNAIREHVERLEREAAR
jgi:hypothetical protein